MMFIEMRGASKQKHRSSCFFSKIWSACGGNDLEFYMKLVLFLSGSITRETAQKEVEIVSNARWLGK